MSFFRLLLSVLIIILMVLSFSSTGSACCDTVEPVIVEEKSKIEVFLENLYRTTMLIDIDSKDLDFWHDSISKGVPGAVVAYSFIFSEEMNKRNLPDGRFVDVLVKALLDREAEASEKTSMIGRLQNDVSRHTIFLDVVNSSEFTRVYNALGVRRSTTRLPARSTVGSTVMTVIWNNIADANFSGISDRPEHIAGIIGNMQSEAGPSLCPFQIQVGNHRGLGLMQWTNPSVSSGGRRTVMEDFMWQNGISQDDFLNEMNKHLTWYCTDPVNLHPQDLLDRVIEEQINFMFHEFGNTWEKQYMEYINYPAVTTGTAGARAYAELFCALVLRPGYGGSFNTVEDSGVLSALGSSPWSSRTSYSALSVRRDRAAAVYDHFG